MVHISTARLCAFTLMVFGVGSARGEDPTIVRANISVPVHVEPGPVQPSVLYFNGAVVNVETQRVWKPLCAGDRSKVTVDQLKDIARFSMAAEAAHPAPAPPAQNIAGGPPPRFDLVFSPTTSIPADALAALQKVEQYIEAQFTDPITVTISFAFSALPPGVLGATSSNYINVTWPNTHNALISGMDLDDVIQNFIPSGSTIPVRYDGNTATVTNETRVFVTIANYRATVGTAVGTAASMTFNSTFSWDYEPPVFENPGTYDFRSVITHEVGHALGFVSGADFRSNDMEMLDVFRFQRSDGTGTDNNPDTQAEFTTTARMVDQNAPGTNDDVNSDIISAEYQMSDGNPNQASHFHDQFPAIGIMDPTIGSGQTFYPNYFRTSDLAMFDAIGYDYPHFNNSCPAADITACNSTVLFDNLPNNNQPIPIFSCGIGTGHVGALWYSFVATHTSAHISTCESAATDLTLAVYDGACNSLVEIGCAESGGCTASANPAACVTDLIPGNTYYIQVAARTTSNRGVVSLTIDCSCHGACCLPAPSTCSEVDEDTCVSLGGAFVGGGTTCAGDLDGDGRDDVCQSSFVHYSQTPTPDQEDIPSNLDLSDMTPDAVVAEGFTTDGRAIRFVRWWGSTLDAAVNPDGWFVSFHEPLVAMQPSAFSLGLYFCPVEKVTTSSMNLPTCDAHPVTSYTVNLLDCCLINSNPDSRSSFVPASPGGFLAEACVDYALGIQAVVGGRFEPDGFGGCTESTTPASASGDFWGWHSTMDDHVAGTAMVSPVADVGSDWFFGPWSAAAAACGNPNVSFELLTSDPPGDANPVGWSNGPPNNLEALTTQFGGARRDWMTVDDIDLPDGVTITDLHWKNEEQSTFAWDGLVRLEIYPDNGAGAPDESGGPTVAMWVPTDGGSVMRTSLGPGQFQPRFQYDITGLNIPLPAGVWWIGAASAGVSGSTGRAYWLTSHKQGVDPIFYGAESHLRAPSAALPTFVGWSTQNGGFKYDMNFDVTVAAFLDCNCNGIPDPQDVGATSSDCNANGTPDECEGDCNGNGVPDDCDVALGGSPDCQPNGVPDECDIHFGTSADDDGGGAPDECCQVIAPPQRDPADFDKSRFITLPPPEPGVRAIRVRLVSLHHPSPSYTGGTPQDFSSFEGQVRWVGPPSQYVESASSQIPFNASTLQCTPYYADWSTVGTLHVTGREIVPSSIYDVQWITLDCAEVLEASFSAPLTISTTRWGDVDVPFNPPSDSAQPDVGDISSMVNKFKSAVGAPIKARALLAGDIPDMIPDVGFTHIGACVDAFKGLGFPHAGPAACPP